MNRFYIASSVLMEGGKKIGKNVKVIEEKDSYQKYLLFDIL